MSVESELEALMRQETAQLKQDLENQNSGSVQTTAQDLLDNMSAHIDANGIKLGGTVYVVEPFKTTAWLYTSVDLRHKDVVLLLSSRFHYEL